MNPREVFEECERIEIESYDPDFLKKELQSKLSAGKLEISIYSRAGEPDTNFDGFVGVLENFIKEKQVQQVW